MSGEQQLKIFVGGLRQETTKEVLNEYFSQYGSADSYVMTDRRTGRSRGFGFVNFRDENTMNTVLQLQHSIEGVTVSVSPYGYDNNRKGGGKSAGDSYSGFDLPETSAPTPSPDNALKIFVGGLSQESTRDSLNAYFTQFGPVDCYVMKDGQTGRSRGFAFANFQDELTYNVVLQTEHQIDGMAVSVSPYGYKGSGRPGGGPVGGGGGGKGGATGGGVGPTDLSAKLSELTQQAQKLLSQTQQPQQPRSQADQELKIFVGGLSQDTTKESLNAHFSQWGYADAYVMKDGHTGRSRGFAFVNFQDPQVMESVLRDSHEIDGVWVSVDRYGYGGGGGRRPASAGTQLPSVATVAKTASLLQDTIAAIGGGGVQAKAGGQDGEPAGKSTKIFVANLSQETSDDMLMGAYQIFNPVQGIVCRDKATGRSKGFGIVEFTTPSIAQLALAAPVTIDGREPEASEYWQKDSRKGGGKGGGTYRSSPY